MPAVVPAAQNPLAAFAADVLLDAVARAEGGTIRGHEVPPPARPGWHRAGDDEPGVTIVLDGEERAFVVQGGELRAFLGWEEPGRLLSAGWRLTVDRGRGLVIEEYFLSGQRERRDEAVGWAVELIATHPLSRPA